MKSLYFKACFAMVYLVGCGAPSEVVKSTVETAGLDIEANAAMDIQAESFDLKTVTAMVKEGKIEDAETLEKHINDRQQNLHHIDIDKDGEIDNIQIVEVKDNDNIVFEFRAIPSKTKEVTTAVTVAYLQFTPDKAKNVVVVKSHYAPRVIGHDVVVYDYTVPMVVRENTIVVDGGVGFYGWVFAVHRPIYSGLVIHPLIAPSVIVVDDKDCWPPGHCKHGKWKSQGHGKGNGHSEGKHSHKGGHHKGGHEKGKKHGH